MSMTIEQIKDVMYMDGTRSGSRDMQFIRQCLKATEFSGERHYHFEVIWKEHSNPNYLTVGGTFDRYGNPIK